MDNNVKKSLLIIMKRSTIPIEISTACIITLNLESFVGVSRKIHLNVQYPID